MAEGDAQNNTRFHFESAGLAGVFIDPASVNLVEALDEPYGAELTLHVDDPDADVALMLGQDCVLTIERPPDNIRRLCGIVRAVHEGNAGGESGWARVVVVPGLWFLSRRRDTRIFQDKTVPEILEEVLSSALGEYGRSIEMAVEGSYPAREYCVQYAESDLDFCHRLMEEEGIFYTFDHEGEQETMVLLDANGSCRQLPTPTGDGVVPFRPQNMQMASDPAHLVHRTFRHTTTSVVVRDWDWTRAGDMKLESESRSEDAMGRDRESYEHGEGRSLTLSGYSGTSYGAEDGAAQAPRRLEAHARDAITIAGVGRALGMTPGLTFELVDHPTVGLDGAYLITRVLHANRPAEELMSDDEAGSSDLYHNVFECIPLDTPYRPTRRTPKPTIAGIQTAVVTGPAGEEIHVDEHGRIKVQFHWDRLGASDENSSCWMRVEQSWAGPSWGFWWVPRIGMEIVVQFIDGDPDRPLVTGSVYNGSNPTPYGLPDEKTKSTIKSNSSLGGGGFNELRFEDKKGAEEIYTHAQKDYNEIVLNDHTTLVHHDQTNTVDHDQTQEVDVDQVETVQGDQQLTVGADRSVHVKNDFTETVEGTETRQVTGDVTESFDANETREIASNVDETIGANETRTIGGNQEESITGNQSRTTTAASTVTIAGTLKQTVVGGVTSTTPAAHNVVAMGGYSVTTPAAITLTAAAGVQIIAPGGVTHVDSIDTWLGALGFKTGLTDEGLFAIKMGTVGAAFDTVGYKFELTGVACSNGNILLRNVNGDMRNNAVKFLIKKLKLEVSGFKAEG